VGGATYTSAKGEVMSVEIIRAGSIILRAPGRETREGPIELTFGVKTTVYGTNNKITMQYIYSSIEI